MQADQGLCLFMLEGPLFYIMANIITHFCVKFIYGPAYEILIVITYVKENADQEVNVSEKTGFCTQTILVQT